MKKNKILSRYFVRLSASWYGDVILQYAKYSDELTLYICDESGLKKSDFVIRWYDVEGEMSPRIEVFDDGWHCFLYFDAVLKGLAEVARNNKRMGVVDVMGYLTDAGFVDKTVHEFKL